jgi:hypothetical protein
MELDLELVVFCCKRGAGVLNKKNDVRKLNGYFWFKNVELKEKICMVI